MTQLSFSDFRANLAASLDRVERDHEALLVTRQGHPNATVMAEAEFRGWQETVYPLPSPAKPEALRATRRAGGPAASMASTGWSIGSPARPGSISESRSWPAATTIEPRGWKAGRRGLVSRPLPPRTAPPCPPSPSA